MELTEATKNLRARRKKMIEEINRAELKYHLSEAKRLTDLICKDTYTNLPEDKEKQLWEALRARRRENTNREDGRSEN